MPPHWSETRRATYRVAKRTLFSEPLPPRNRKVDNEKEKRRRDLPQTVEEFKEHFGRAFSNLNKGKEQYALRICIKHDFTCPQQGNRL